MVLPVSEPIITHTPPIANLFSILGTNPKTESWIMNNFINIYIQDSGVFDNFYDRNTFFYGCPWIQVVQTRREIIQNMCNLLIEYIKILLDMEFYVYAVGNTQYIKAYKQDSYYAHNFMIYGYDDINKEFYIADFFINGKYSLEKCSYDELEKALQTADVNRNFVNLIYGMKLKDIEYKFELDLLPEMLEDYLNSVNIFCKYKTRQDEEYYSNKGGNKYYYFSYSEMQNKYFFGLSYYDKLIDMAKNKSKRLRRPLDLVYEHKLLMGKRLNFLFKNQYISVDSYQKLKLLCDTVMEKSLIERNLFIKYRMTADDRLLNQLVVRINESKSDDENFMESFLREIKLVL